MRISRLEYRSYIRSPAWEEVKRRFYRSRLYRGRCEACLATDKPLDLHHKTYTRLGYERLSDLIPLCRECHEKTHEVHEANDHAKFRLKDAHKQVRGDFRRARRKAHRAKYPRFNVLIAVILWHKEHSRFLG